MRRQYLAFGASRRTRYERLEGPRAAGNAGPHAVPADRGPALSCDAAALWLLLVPAQYRSEERAGKGPAPRHHNVGHRARLGKYAVELDPAHFRGRSAAELHARAALVRR